MNRHAMRLALGLAALGFAATLAQGCAERRYGVAPQPAAPRAPVAQPQAAAQPQPAPPPPAAVVQPAPQPQAAAPQPAPTPPPQPQQQAAPQPVSPPQQQQQAAAGPQNAPPASGEANLITSPVPPRDAEPERTADGKLRVRASNATDDSAAVPLVNIDEVPDEVARKLEEYRLGPGDRLSIKVFGQEEISGEFEVSAAGELSYPLIGQITAENMTPGEFNRVLTGALEEFFVSPQVTVEVTNYRPFFILGQVGSPGSYKYQPGLNARMAIAVGGGYTRRAREEPITIFRTNNAGELIKFEADQDAIILPGDTIEVHRRLF